MNHKGFLFIEEAITGAVKKLLDWRVNEILANWEFFIPVVEFGHIQSKYATSPVVSLISCEKTDKERIIRQDAYSLTISFPLQEHPDGELYCYGYAAAFNKALGEDVTLGGIVDRAVLTEKKYVPPKKPHNGEGWELVIKLRITLEEMAV